MPQNLATLILGEPDRVFASGCIGASGVDEQIAAILHFGAGKDALIDCSITRPRRQEFETCGHRGVTAVDLPPDDAIRNLAVVDAVVRSLHSGQPVFVLSV